MTNFNCTCRSDCTGIAFVASIIIGIITAFLSFNGVITVTPAFLWVLFGIAVVYLAVTLVLSVAIRNSGGRSCLCPILSVTLTAILGTVLTSVVLLGITFAATSLLGAIITGLLLAFFTLILVSVVCLINCIAGCDN